MMIKFRAWDKDEHEYFIDGSAGTLFNLVCCDDLSMMIPDDYIWEQSTGLKDVNGKEIYENDLVRLTDDLEDPVFRVIFDEGKFEISGDDLCYDLGEEFMNCEVIGNVHINPELLEEDE